MKISKLSFSLKKILYNLYAFVFKPGYIPNVSKLKIRIGSSPSSTTVNYMSEGSLKSPPNDSAQNSPRPELKLYVSVCLMYTIIAYCLFPEDYYNTNKISMRGSLSILPGECSIMFYYLEVIFIFDSFFIILYSPWGKFCL